MRAQDYIDQYLPQLNQATDENQVKEICSNAFIAFLNDTAALVKSRNALDDEAIISILNDEGDKWHKFCRLINQQQNAVQFNESMFLDYWRDRLDLS